MISDPIIKTPCETDFYKLTMKAAVFHHFPEAEAEYKFVCRTPGVDLRSLEYDIFRQLESCTRLSYSVEEIKYLSKIPYFSKGYLRFLSTQQWSPADVDVRCVGPSTNGGLEIRVKGPWLYTIDWEIWLLKIISELYTRKMIKENPENPFFEVGTMRLAEKLRFLKDKVPDLRFTDMGARRAATCNWHYNVLRLIKDIHPDCLAGTSDVYLARLFDIPCFGTHAHEWDSAHLAFYHPLDAKRMAMQHWLEAFGGDAGICLTDTFTTDHFLTVFNKQFANAYTGVRHDSGDWLVWAKKILAHYRKLGIDPQTKTLVFSDGLDFPTMVKIYQELKDSCRVGFGIGTNLCNDIGFQPLNIVIKMVGCNGRPVLKLSDVYGKTTCEDPIFLPYVQRALGVVQE